MHITREESDVRQKTRDLIKEMLDEGTFSGTPPSDLEENPPDFRYFLDYDEEHDALNVAALATNTGLYDEKEKYWTGEAHEIYHTGQFSIATPSEGLVPTFFRSNSGVSWSGVDPDALGPEIQRDLAEKIHPRLFERID